MVSQMRAQKTRKQTVNIAYKVSWVKAPLGIEIEHTHAELSQRTCPPLPTSMNEF